MILLNRVKKQYTTKNNRNMSTHMAHVEYEIAQITISQQLHKQKSEILKNTTLMINGSNSYVI